MSDPNLPVDPKALTEPVTKLIEAVKDAVGALYEPTRIRRKARAEGDALVLLARSQTQVREIEVRASERIKRRELHRQDNLEKITNKAIAALPESVSNQPVDPDWISRFFEDCQDIGNGEMQTLWSKLLAGEVAQPGRFSFRTLRVVRDLSSYDAEMFSSLCRFTWILNQSAHLIVPDKESPIVSQVNLSYGHFLHLESIGLIQLDSLTGC